MSARRLLLLIGVGVAAIAGAVWLRIQVEQPVVAEGTLLVEPALVSPGDQAEVYFPEELTRNPALFLQGRDDEGRWSTWYILYSTGGNHPPGDPSYVESYRHWGTDAVAFDGELPSRILIPPQLRPGEYRVCTTSPALAACGAVEVDRD